jgi:hypothetical protein
MRQLTKSYRIRLSEETVRKLNHLKQFNIIPSRFIRIAIDKELSLFVPEKITKSNIPF